MGIGDPMRQGPAAEESYRLVRDAGERYRLAGNKLARAQRALKDAQRQHEIAARDLGAAIQAVQLMMWSEPEPAQGELGEELP